jgi:hypothetical protein
MKHLSSEEISSVVAGISISEEAHVHECADCAQEVERLANMLSLFRGSVREWTDRLDHSEFPVREAVVSRVRRSRAPHRASMAWVVVAAAFAAAVAIPMYQDSREQEVQAQAKRDAQLRDAQLMDDVNEQLSRSGPLAMDPLMRLMAFPDNGPGTNLTKSHGIASGIARGVARGIDGDN